MKKIAFIIPWIGKLPNYFQLWLISCKWNPTIDFLLFTDDREEYDYPENVKVFYITFQEIQKLIQKNFDFNVSINEPYKLCDFRPAYGEIFSDYLNGYDFWGHCDIDLIWGNIRKFVTDDVLSKYEKIFSRGHCSLYKNNLIVNAWYRTLPQHGCQNWTMVFQSSESRCFDEWADHCGGGMSRIIQLNGIKIFDKVYAADLNVMKGYFSINREMSSYDKSLYFKFSQGELLAITKKQKKEYMYCHFQKRIIRVDSTLDYNCFFFIAPNLVTSDRGKIKRKFVKEILFVCDRLRRKIGTKIKNYLR